MKEVVGIVLCNKKEGAKIILTDEALIIKKGIIKKKFKRSKIKSIKITEDFRISILYGNKVYSTIVNQINEEEFEKVKGIFNILNQEKILFYSEDNRVKKKSYILIAILFWCLSILSGFVMVSLQYILFVIGLGYFIGFLYLKCALQCSYQVLYKANTNEFIIKYGVNKCMEISLDDEQYKIKYDREKHKYLLRKNNEKIISFYNGVIYPLYYKDHLNKMMKVKLDID